MKSLEDYNVYLLRDCYDNQITDKAIALHQKHKLSDFQEAIDKAKEEHQEEINAYGDDWQFIGVNISKEFDWFEININIHQYLTY